MADYIYPAPGASDQVTLKLFNNANASDTTGVSLPSLQDVTINNANDVFTWTQLDADAKKQVATTATNSIATNLVVNQTTFFGTDYANATGNVATSTAAEFGVFGLSKDKVKVDFELYMGDESEGSTGPTISGAGYITGLAPTVSADAPVWVSPVTITVDGEYSFSIA